MIIEESIPSVHNNQYIDGSSGKPMSNLQVYFDLPPHLSTLLANGTLERVGGVIRETRSKEVVMWLRESAKAAQPVVPPTAPILSNMASLVATGQLVNLTLSAFTLYTVVQRMEKLTHQIDALGDLVRKEFNRNREDEFCIALNKARDAVESDNLALRHSDATDTANRLAKFTENFLNDLRRILATSKDLPDLLLAQQYLIRAIYAQTCRIQCYLAIDEEKLAKTRFAEDLRLFEVPVQELLTAWMGESPAIYFHKDVPFETLEHFMRLQTQRLGDDLQPHEAMLRVIDLYRADFWNPQILPTKIETMLGLMNPFGSSKNKTDVMDLPQELATRLTQAELTLENYQRLLGFELELRTKRLDYSAWNELVSTEELDQHGMAVIMTEEYHQRLVES